MARRSLRPGRAAADAEDVEEEGRKALRPLAAQIRIAYILAYRAHFQARVGVPSNFGSKPMPRWDGGVASDGRTYKPIWYRIAREALVRQIAPDDLIRGAFRDWDRKEPPWPTNLLSEATLAWAQQNPGITIEDTQRALGVQKDIWDLQIFLYRDEYRCDFATAARAVLRNRRLELSSIFRYCMAVEGQDGVTAAEFEGGAVVQYIYNRRAYDQGWGELIPPRLRSIADRLTTA